MRKLETTVNQEVETTHQPRTQACNAHKKPETTVKCQSIRKQKLKINSVAGITTRNSITIIQPRTYSSCCLRTTLTLQMV